MRSMGDPPRIRPKAKLRNWLESTSLCSSQHEPSFGRLEVIALGFDHKPLFIIQHYMMPLAFGLQASLEV